MNDNMRARLLDCVGQIGEFRPNMRFGQLVANLATVSSGFTISATWDVEDEALLATAEEYLEKLKPRDFP